MVDVTKHFGNLSYSGADMVVTMQMPNVLNDNGGLAVYTLGTLQTLTYSTHMDRRPVRAIGNVNAKDFVSGPRTIAGTLIFAVFNKHFAYEALEAITNKESAKFSFFADEMPPFDITVSFANEYGSCSRLALYGVRLVNEGQVMSVNDIYTENTYQFVARDMDYMTDVDGATNSSSKATTVVASSVTDNSNGQSSQSLLNDVTSGNSSLSNIINTSSKTNMVNLIVSTTDVKVGSLNGTAKMNIDPPQKTGTIYINGGSLAKEMELNISNYINSSTGVSTSIYVNLPSGNYSAEYVDISTTTYSSIKSFAINQNYGSSTNQNPPPLMLGVSDTRMLLMSNVINHDTIKYAETGANLSDSDFSVAVLNNQKVLLTGLKANTNYTIYSKNDSSSSVIAQVTTKTSDYEDYSKLKNYISNNQNCMVSGATLSNYYQIIDDAYGLSSSSSFTTFYDALDKEKIKLVSIYNGIDIKNYNTNDEYQAALNAAKININVCNHILIISEDITNNEQYIINEKENGLSTTPLQPKFIDSIKYTILLSKNTERIEIYGLDDSNKNRDSVCSKTLFKRYNDNYLEYTVNVRPSTKYTIYAVNSSNAKSPKFEFYVPDDDTRSSISQKASSDTTTFNSLYTSAYNNVEQVTQNNNLNSDDLDVLTLQSIKSASTKVFTAPVIVQSTYELIEVKIDNSYLNVNCINDYYIVLADASKMCSTELFIKKKISEYGSDISFTDKEDMIKKDMTYALWIEDKNKLQVSPTSIAKTTATGVSDNVDTYNKKSMVDDITNLLSNTMAITDDINNCIQALLGDSDVDSSNIYDTLIENIITHKPIIKDVRTICMTLFKLKIERSSSVNVDFFNSAIIIDSKNMTVGFPALSDSYTIVKYDMPIYTKTSVVQTMSTVQTEKTFNIESDYKLIAFVCVSKDIYNKSGIIFVDTYDKTFYNYKIRMEVL